MKANSFLALAVASFVLISCEKIPDNELNESVAEKTDSDSNSPDNPWLGQCGHDDKVHRFIIDASEMNSIVALGKKIDEAGGKPVQIAFGDFEGEDFRPLANSLDHACFDGTKLADTNWESSEIASITFLGVDLSRANLRRVSFKNVKFDKIKMIAADLARADLSDGELQGSQDTDISSSDFSGAILRSFKFSCLGEQDSTCTSRSSDTINFSDTDLLGANLEQLITWGKVDFTGAKLSRARVNPREIEHLSDANFEGGIVLTAGLGRNAVVLEAGEAESLSSEVQRETAIRKTKNLQGTAPFSRGSHIDLANLGQNEAVEFYEEVLPVSDEFANSRLYQRITAVLKDAAWQNAKISRTNKLEFKIEGSASGGGGSVCGLHGDDFRYDQKSQYLSTIIYPAETQREPVRKNVFKVRGRVLEMTFPYSWDDRQAMEGFITCGHRSSFNDLIYIE